MAQSAPNQGGGSSGDAGLQQRLQQLPTFARELIAGGLAGGLAKTCVAPLERTKILFQTGRLPLAATVPETLTFLWRSEGLYGLFKGNTASVARIVPYAAIHFSAYEYYRRMLLGSYEGPVNPVWDLMAGSAAGATAVLLTYPMDLIRAQLAWQTEVAASATSSSHHAHKHPNIRSTATNVWKSGGLASLFRGIFPTLMGILPYAGLKFYVYQSLKGAYRDWSKPIQPQNLQNSNDAITAKNTTVHSQSTAKDGPLVRASEDVGTGTSVTTSSSRQHERPQVPNSVDTAAVVSDVNGGGRSNEGTQGSKTGNRGSDRLPVGIMLLFGGISGLVGQSATYPLDVVRRRMQVYGLQHASSSTVDQRADFGRDGQAGNGAKHATGTSTANAGGSNAANASASNAANVGGSAATSNSGNGSVVGNSGGPLQAGSKRSTSCSHTVASDTGVASSRGVAGEHIRATPQPTALSASSATCGSAGSVGSSAGARTVGRRTGAPLRTGGVETGVSSWVDGRGRDHHCSKPATVSRPMSAQYVKVVTYVGSASKAQAPSTWQVVKEIVSEGGLKALYRGLSINYMKVVPSTAIGFTVYDALKAYLDLKNNL